MPWVRALSARVDDGRAKEGRCVEGGMRAQIEGGRRRRDGAALRVGCGAVGLGTADEAADERGRVRRPSGVAGALFAAEVEAGMYGGVEALSLGSPVQGRILRPSICS